MLKTIKAILLATVISIGVVGCTAAELAEEPTNLEEVAEMTEEEVVEETTPEKVLVTSVYENEDCGFVMSFPENWGEVTEVIRESDGSTATYFDLTSQKDSALTMTVLAVRGDHSRYTTPVGVTETCMLYVDEAEEDEAIRSITDTFAVVNGDLAKYSNEVADFSFEYPKEMHLAVSNEIEDEPSVSVGLGWEYNQNGYLLHTAYFVVYPENYNKWMEENANFPWVEHGDACEEELPGTKLAFGCEDLAMGISSHFRIQNLGDLGLRKYYHYERKGVTYPSLEVFVDMWTDDYVEAADSENITELFKSGELTPQQLEKIALVDSILETLNF